MKQYIVYRKLIDGQPHSCDEKGVLKGLTAEAVQYANKYRIELSIFNKCVAVKKILTICVIWSGSYQLNFLILIKKEKNLYNYDLYEIDVTLSNNNKNLFRAGDHTRLAWIILVQCKCVNQPYAVRFF